jgi:hypothetical protein
MGRRICGISEEWLGWGVKETLKRMERGLWGWGGGAFLKVGKGMETKKCLRCVFDITRLS